MCALPSLSVLALARASDLGSAFVPKIYLVLRFMHDSPKLFWFHPASFISSSRASCAFEIHVTLLSHFRFRLRPVFCAQLLRETEIYYPQGARFEASVTVHDVTRLQVPVRHLDMYVVWLRRFRTRENVLEWIYK